MLVIEKKKMYIEKKNQLSKSYTVLHAPSTYFVFRNNIAHTVPNQLVLKGDESESMQGNVMVFLVTGVLFFFHHCVVFV